MGQLNRGPSFSLARTERARDSERRLGRSDRDLEQGTAEAGARSDEELHGMPPRVPQIWPRVFPGL